MALRAVSIVGLESSIRTQFDRQIDEIQRDLENRERRRHESNNTLESNSTVTTTENQANTNDQVEDETNEAETSETRTELPLPGISRSPSVTVDYPDFPTSPDLPENDDSDNSDHEIDQRPTTNPHNMTCCQFYRNHWLGHLITGVISGCLFVLLGVVFLVQSNDFPHYAGVTLIILGLAPCCMAVNRYRYVRLYEQERRRAMRRLRAIRQQHRRNRRESRRRRRQQFSDTPPSYDNLGFDSDEEDETEIDGDANVTSVSRSSSFVLPSYEECIKKSPYNERVSRKHRNQRMKETPYVISIDETRSNENNNVEPPEITVTSYEEDEFELPSYVSVAPVENFNIAENNNSVSSSSGEVNIIVENITEEYTIL